MPGLGAGHWWLIAIVLVIVLIIWGPGKLPDVGSGLGRAIREFRKASSETRDEFVKATRPDETPASPAAPAAGTGPVATPATIPGATAPVAQPAPVGAGAPEQLPTGHAAGEGDHTTAG